MKVNEIFYSLQGEGCHTGTPAVFVRFSGCNLHCPFCDTLHDPYTEMSVEEIVAEVNRHPAQMVVLTGGEPLLQVSEALTSALHEQTGKLIAVETNGTQPLPRGIDWVTVSPKGDPATCVIERADEIKVVDLGQPLEPYLALPCYSEDVRLSLQPCYVADPQKCAENLRNTIQRVMQNPTWVLSLQTHRLLGIR